MCEMKGHIEKTVDRYLELSGKPMNQLAKVPTPCIDDHLNPVEEFKVKRDPSLNGCKNRTYGFVFRKACSSRLDVDCKFVSKGGY